MGEGLSESLFIHICFRSYSLLLSSPCLFTTFIGCFTSHFFYRIFPFLFVIFFIYDLPSRSSIYFTTCTLFFLMWTITSSLLCIIYLVFFFFTRSFISLWCGFVCWRSLLCILSSSSCYLYVLSCFLFYIVPGSSSLTFLVILCNFFFFPQCCVADKEHDHCDEWTWVSLKMKETVYLFCLTKKLNQECLVSLMNNCKGRFYQSCATVLSSLLSILENEKTQ